MKTAIIGSLTGEYGGGPVSGIAVHTTALASSLAGLGHQVSVLAHGQRPGASASTSATFDVLPLRHARGADLAASLFRRPIWTMGQIASGKRQAAAMTVRERAAVAALADQYERLLRRVRPDVIHNQGTGLSLMAANVAARRLGVPLVATVHSLSGHLPEGVFKRIAVPSLRLPARLITVSPFLAKEAESLGVQADRITAIPNGVDTRSFSPVPRGEACARLVIPPGPRNVLFVGNLIRRKGVDVLIEAFAQVAREAGDARLYIVGGPGADKDSEWLERLRATPERLGISARVAFAGEVAGHESGVLRDWYCAADCLVLPSRSEGMGLVLVEAMACGTPVVGSRVGGIPDVIIEGENGLLVPPGEPMALAQAIGRLLLDDGLRRQLGARGRELTLERYSWDTVARRTIEVYRRSVTDSAR